VAKENRKFSILTVYGRKPISGAPKNNWKFANESFYP
jgi:hypothetical protein